MTLPGKIVRVLLIAVLIHFLLQTHQTGKDLGWHTLRQKATLSTWAQFPESLDKETTEVQRVIYKSQNPRDCETRNYFLWTPYNYGMGSDIHTIGCALAFAIESNRTLLYNPWSKWVYTSDICHSNRNPDCYFEPLSRCQYIVNNVKKVGFKRYNGDTDDWYQHQFVDLAVCERELVPHSEDWATRGTSWWRTQATRYIVRPSSSFMAWTRQFFAQALRSYPSIEEWNSTSSSPPDEAICIHVRHGDKYKEMSLHSMDEYLEAANGLVETIGASRNIFFSTDNGTIIEEIEKGSYQSYNFTFFYTRYERRTDDASPMATARDVGKSRFGRQQDPTGTDL